MTFQHSIDLDKWLEPYTSDTLLGALVSVVLLLGLLLNAHVALARTRRQLADMRSADQVMSRAAIASRQARARVGALAAGASGAIAAATLPQRNAQVPTDAYRNVKIYIDHATLTQTWKDLDPANSAVEWGLLSQTLLYASGRLPMCKDRLLVYCGSNVYGSYFADAYYDLLLAQNDPATASTMILPAFRPHRKSQLRQELAPSFPATMANREAALTDAVNKEVAKEIEKWRSDSRHDRDELLDGIRKHFGYVTFPVERPATVLRTANYTADGIPFTKEKGVDNRIATDLVADAVCNIFDVAIVVASDADFVPPIQFLVNELGKSVIQVGLPQFSRAIRAAASAHLELMDIFTAIRPPAAAANANEPA